MGVAAVLTKRDKGGWQQCVDINSQFKGQPILENNSYFNFYMKIVLQTHEDQAAVLLPNLLPRQDLFQVLS